MALPPFISAMIDPVTSCLKKKFKTKLVPQTNLGFFVNRFVSSFLSVTGLSVYSAPRVRSATLSSQVYCLSGAQKRHCMHI